jgi:hypothetical protein
MKDRYLLIINLGIYSLTHRFSRKRKRKVGLVHSYGPQKYDKVKEPANKVAVLPPNHEFDKLVDIKESTVRTKIDGLKNRSEQCEELGRGVDGLKNRSGICEGSGEGGSTG